MSPSRVDSELALPPRYQLRAIVKQTTRTYVARVFDVSDGREEALKVLLSSVADPQDLLRFRAEFATLATLDHPAVIAVDDYGVLDSGFPYFTMEYFEGKKITEFFDGHDWDALYDALLQIVAALDHIHRRGIIHFDLKPSNILVSNEGIAKITDFGLAVERFEIFDRKIRGTLQYMAPEVLRQDRVDARADLYALGMTLYETVTGALPGYGRETMGLIRMHFDEQIRPVSAINPRVPKELERIIMRLLEKDPRDRYRSAARLGEAVAAAAGVDPPRVASLSGRPELHAAPLIGRKDEVDQLMALVGEARQGRGNGVIVAGAEGLGKNRIVREATLRAQLDGARVFCGRCAVNGKTIYAPFFDIFRQMVLAVNPTADVGREIRRITRPVVGTSASETSPARRGQKYRLYNRIIHSMQDMYGFLSVQSGAAATPLILVVEDLQWADPSTAELFSFLTGEAKRNSLLIIGTLTLDPGGQVALDAPPPSLSFWEQRARESAFPLMRIETLTEPLVREHVQSLLGQRDFPDDLVRWILWESAGSPLQIRRIIEYLIAHQHLEWRSGEWVADVETIRTLRVPGGFASLLMEKVSALQPETRSVLETLSVIGAATKLTLLIDVSDLPAERTYASVRELVELNLLDESSDGTRLSFAQIHLRDAVYNGVAEKRRREIHLRTAEVLEVAARDGSAEVTGEVAYHFSRATDVERGSKYSVEAGDIASQTLAHEEATEFYRVALELMDLGGMPESRKAEVREKLADSYYRRDDYRNAIHLFQFLLKSIQSRQGEETANADVARLMKKTGKALARRGDNEAAMTCYQSALATYERLDLRTDVAETLNRIAWLHRLRDDLEVARLTAERARTILGDGEPTVVRGYIENVLGLIEFARGNWIGSREILTRAVAIAERLDSESLLRVASLNLGNTLWKLGEWDGALETFRRNMEQAERDGDLSDLVAAYNNVGVVAYGRGDFRAAAELFEKSVRIDERIGAVEHEALARENLADALEMLGRWDEALEQYRRCTSLEGFDETRASRLSVYVPLARLTRKMGDITTALNYAQKALAAGERARDEDLIAEAAYVISSIEEERGNMEAAEEYLARASSIFEANRTVHGMARTHVAAAVFALQNGDLEGALSHASTAHRQAEELGDRFTGAKADWALAKIHNATGERDLATARFEAARDAFEALDTPYELARLLFDMGLLREDPDEATLTIRSAIRIFERLNATQDLERARGALFRILPPGKTPESGVAGLYEIVRIINSTLDLQEVLSRVLDVCIRRLRAERGMILLLDPLTGALRTRVVRNIREDATGEDKRSPHTIVGEVIRTGQAVISADARVDDRFAGSESVITDNIVSILCAPVIIKERIAGAIYIDHREARHLFSQKDLAFLEAFAGQAAIAIENARLYEELQEARTRLSLENESLRREVLVEKHLDSIVGQSDAVSKIQFATRKAAAGHSTVLLRGESGTGKGLIARIIHNIGPRRNGPFIKFNCAALPESLAESELFGHERGAFTGADRRKLGRFELANGGTIFLDEIGKISLAMQAKLLRVVEEKEFERVGGTQTIKTDIKVVAATNLDIERAIAEGTFREDLYYRLNIIPIMLPPLRERKDDIPLLTEHFIRKICHDLGIENKHLEPGVLDLFLRHDWPGNVRELESTLHRAIVMSNDTSVGTSEFYNLFPATATLAGGRERGGHPDALLGSVSDVNGDVYETVMASVDRQLIIRALDSSGGRIREAARRLGLARNTLKSKIQKYGISVRE
jgi:Nif-specific regulatory protein